MRAPTIYESDDLSLTIHTVSITPAPMYRYGLLTPQRLLVQNLTTIIQCEQWHSYCALSAICIISLVHISAGSYISTLHPHAWISSIQVIEWCHWHWEYWNRHLQYEFGSHKSSSLETNYISSIYSYLPPIPVQGWVFISALCYVQHFWDIVLCFLVLSMLKCKLFPRAGR